MQYLEAVSETTEWSLFISKQRELQIKTTLKYHLTPVRMALIQKSTNNKCWKGCGRKDSLFGGKIKWYSHYGEQHGGSFKNLGIKLSYDPAIPLGHVTWENHYSKRHMYPSFHCSTVYNSQDMEATSMSINRWMDKDFVVYMFIQWNII